ncbi:hypothetical protein B0T20DRAFT_401493 [Sordaria brevicollis]|uniref:Uncharacterized protein n=1 Tax=Sordaria brevicollis TaxID=83679 RepID=A0AAE0PK19_SORBR|nr:hypothetical protein B0T20DRAFT_401493 [Sordaria brevicollis]
MSPQTPRHLHHLRPTQLEILSGLDTASDYLSETITRYRSAHADKYSIAILSKLLELDEEIEEMLDIRDFRIIRNIQALPGDFGTRILCILANLNAMNDCMDEVDRLEEGWVWVGEAEHIPMDVNGVEEVEEVKEVKEVKEVEKVKQVEEVEEVKEVEEIESAEAKDGQKSDAGDERDSVGKTDARNTDPRAEVRDPVIGGKYVVIDENGNEEEAGSADGRKSTDSDFVLIDKDGEDGGMEAENGTNIGEQGLLTTLQKYLKALKVR